MRAYAQKEPLAEYRRESHILFRELLENFDKWLEENAKNFQQSTINKEQLTQASKLNLANSQMSAVNGQKVGRNDSCPCGNGKKFKKCHGA